MFNLFKKKDSKDVLIGDLQGREAEAIRSEAAEKERFRLAAIKGKQDARARFGPQKTGKGFDTGGMMKKLNKMSKDLENF